MDPLGKGSCPTSWQVLWPPDKLKPSLKPLTPRAQVPTNRSDTLLHAYRHYYPLEIRILGTVRVPVSIFIRTFIDNFNKTQKQALALRNSPRDTLIWPLRQDLEEASRLGCVEACSFPMGRLRYSSAASTLRLPSSSFLGFILRTL